MLSTNIDHLCPMKHLLKKKESKSIVSHYSLLMASSIQSNIKNLPIDMNTNVHVDLGYLDLTHWYCKLNLEESSVVLLIEHFEYSDLFCYSPMKLSSSMTLRLSDSIRYSAHHSNIFIN